MDTIQVSACAEEVAPDGSAVRPLLRRPGGSLAQVRLGPGKTSSAVVHRAVDELWYIVAGRGEMWRAMDGEESIVALQQGVCLSIPAGVAFQFKTVGAEPLEAVAVTMPPWPGDEEARRVPGCQGWTHV